MEEEKEDTKPARRLCSEIQLFDLCDREACGYKEGRFCTDQEMLERFEGIAEEEARPVGRCPSGEPDDDDDDDEAGYDDGFGDDGYDDEGDGWEDE